MPKEGHTGAQLTADGLMIEFVWREDRYAHTISAGTIKLEAIELVGWETPVFQEVHQQGDLVFASGMAGDRHWSASVEMSDEGLLFDVACRLKSLPSNSLGSAYTDWEKEHLQIVGKPAGSSPPPQLKTIDQTLTIAAAVDEVSLPTTLRYRYAVILPSHKWIESGNE